jgi:hypothetical protein
MKASKMSLSTEGNSGILLLSIKRSKSWAAAWLRWNAYELDKGHRTPSNEDHIPRGGRQQLLKWPGLPCLRFVIDGLHAREIAAIE